MIQPTWTRCVLEYTAGTRLTLTPDVHALTVPFFAQIPDELYKQLAELCTYESFNPGQTVFEEGKHVILVAS